MCLRQVSLTPLEFDIDLKTASVDGGNISKAVAPAKKAIVTEITAKPNRLARTLIVDWLPQGSRRAIFISICSRQFVHLLIFKCTYIHLMSSFMTDSGISHRSVIFTWTLKLPMSNDTSTLTWWWYVKCGGDVFFRHSALPESRLTYDLKFILILVMFCIIFPEFDFGDVKDWAKEFMVRMPSYFFFAFRNIQLFQCQRLDRATHRFSQLMKKVLLHCWIFASTIIQ